MHGNSDSVCGSGQQVVVGAVLLGPDGDGHAAGQVGVGVEQVGLGRGDDQTDVLGGQPVEGLGGRGGGHGHGEDGSLARADDVRVAPVGDRVGGDDGGHARRVGGPEHGAEVARLLDPLGHEEQGVVVDVERGQGAADGGDDAEQPVRTLPVRDLLEGGPAEPHDLGAELPSVLDEVLLAADVLATRLAGRAEQLGADEEGLRPNAGGQREGQLLVTLDEGGSGVLTGPATTERDDRLQPRVRGRGDEQVRHGGSQPHRGARRRRLGGRRRSGREYPIDG